MENFADTDVWVICFETVGAEFAGKLHRALVNDEIYMGAVQVDDAAKIHWELYSDSLGLRYRISDRSITLFEDDALGDELPEDEEEDEIKRLRDIGFASVSFDETHGKHLLFDRYHNFEQARRVAEWKDHIPEPPSLLFFRFRLLLQLLSRGFH